MAESANRVYLDVCALCRPFDDQAQMRIRLETEAVQLILSHVRSESLTLVVSSVHDVEISAIDVSVEREHLLSMLSEIGDRVAFDSHLVRRRAKQLTEEGLGPADAAHLAFAETAGASFVTCDDRLIRQCRRIQPNIWFGDPMAFCSKEDL
jgi:predicted nucleic acid-binding protein